VLTTGRDGLTGSEHTKGGGLTLKQPTDREAIRKTTRKLRLRKDGKRQNSKKPLITLGKKTRAEKSFNKKGAWGRETRMVFAIYDFSFWVQLSQGKGANE